MSFIARVAQLSSITGMGLGPEETAIIRILQGKVNNLEAELRSKLEKISFLDEQLEQADSELRIQEKIHQDYLYNIGEDIKRFRGGQDVLVTFIEYLQSNEFDINSLRIEVSEQSQRFWRDLKPYHDKGKKLSSELDELKKLRAQCVELREKAAQMNNPI